MQCSAGYGLGWLGVAALGAAMQGVPERGRARIFAIIIILAGLGLVRLSTARLG